MARRNRVVITGIGVLAPNGIGLEAFWDSLIHCRSGIGPITLFDASDLKSRIAGEVKGFNPLDYIEPELKPKRMARHTQLAYAAAMMALKDAGLSLRDQALPNPVPVILGVSSSAMDVIERGLVDFERRGAAGISPAALDALSPQAAANVIANRLGDRAHAATISAACPSGIDAVGLAANMIRRGEAEMAIAGGCDAPVNLYTLAAFIAAGLASTRNGEPQRASRPFDRSSDSGVVSEGAGVFILEDLERAEARGAAAYLEISGHARTRDQGLDRIGSGLAEAMRLALANASRSKEEIDYISAYGPGHPVLDAAEVSYIKEVFGERAYSIPVTSVKGVTGNPLCAGGPFQVAACALSFRDQMIPPTTNHLSGGPDCDLDFVPERPRRGDLNCALINVRGLGGSATSLVVNRVPCW